MWRGFTVFEFMNQCFSNHLDRTAKGRQMPTFYGAKDLHFVTTSPPLATQMPQGMDDIERFDIPTGHNTLY